MGAILALLAVAAGCSRGQMPPKTLNKTLNK